MVVMMSVMSVVTVVSMVSMVSIVVMTTATMSAAMPAMPAVMIAMTATAALPWGRNCTGRAKRKCYGGHDNQRQDRLLQTVHGILPNEKRCLLF
jgi:hypothetical protein